MANSWSGSDRDPEKAQPIAIGPQQPDQIAALATEHEQVSAFT